MVKIIKILIFFICISCSSNIESKNGKIKFTLSQHDFGTLPTKMEVKHSFEFSNPGEKVLIIYDVKTSCGCTVAEWPQKPIKPKRTDKITVNYDSEFPGMFHKEISVYYNGEDSPAILQIRGQVEYPEEKNTVE